ncbi:alpha-L-rhamnosidase C-terminal domain-containing protein [Leifsonia sp. NPDC058194]|uniref:alpha-L-rhamnosidase-related protein n=1 Tax=Leifsonia sp. NPDC058194 TaxID=3346374 RepID=UPI0036D94E9F
MTWYYPPHQRELGMLHTLVRAGFAANRNVDYALNFASTARAAEFRVDGGAPILVEAEEGEPPALYMPHPASLVETREPGTSAWMAASPVSGDEEAPPHVVLEPRVPIPLTLRDGLWESDRPVLGRPVLRSAARPLVSSGESREEALADPDAAETRHDVVALGDGRWTTAHQLGFRYLRVESPADDVAEVTVHASQRPIARAGSFTCSDDTLTRIWQVSADTLHACMHGLMIDGVKRDRMPWIGDQALNTLSNGYAFGDRGIVTDGLVALGRPRHGYVNGIADYSLWWLIGTALLARTFDAADYLAAEAGHIHAFTERLAADAGADGLFRPQATGDDFHRLVFIDWGVETDPTRDSTALQILWLWALRSAASTLSNAGHDGAARWAGLADTVLATLRATAWDRDAGAWREYADRGSAPSPYPNLLAVLAGLNGADDAGIRALLLATPRAGTPFMTAFLLRALIELGESDAALERIRSLWGGMLDSGARSFWEEFGDDGPAYAMYGRPFGKSLCHAWSSGPAALLPDAVLGIRPLADGWSRFAVAPRLGALAWAEARVPAPQGDIIVAAQGRTVTVEVPAGATLVTGGAEHPGPASVGWTVP